MATVTCDYVTASFRRWSVSSTYTQIGFCVLCIISVGIWRRHENSTHDRPLQQEVWIEWLSWALIFGFSRVIGESEKAAPVTLRRQSFWASRSAVWFTSVMTVLSQLLSSQNELTWTLPLTTIAVTVCAYLQRKRSPENMFMDEEKEATSSSLLTKSFSDHKELNERLGLPLPLILNAACFFLLVDYSNLIPHKTATFYGILFLVTRATTILCIARLQRSSDDHQIEPTAPIIGRNLSRLSMHTLGLLTIYLMTVRPELPSIRILVVHAIAQAFWWLSFITLIRLRLVNTVTNLDSIALSGQMALTGTDIRSTAIPLLTGLFSVTQSFAVLQPGPAVRRMVYTISVLFILIVWLHCDQRTTDTFQTTTTNMDGQVLHRHPIENLIGEKRSEFAKVLARQSKTLYEATKEYERRYGRAPPAGFDRWFEIAQDNGFVLVDEFDTFMQSMEPFHGIHPTILQQRLDKALNTTDVLGRACVIHFKDKNITYGAIDETTGFLLMEEFWFDAIPYDMTVALNYFDEPMVSAPWDEVGDAIRRGREKSVQPAHEDGQQTHSLELLNLAKQNTWAATRSACPVDSPSRGSTCPERTFQTSLHFISNVTESKDVCLNCELKNEHGVLFKPDNILISTELSPLWSPSKPSHFNDILYPGAFYISVRGDYKPDLDSAWEDKDNKFYWVGRSTGGYATEDSWTHLQRQRLVLKTSQNNNEQIQLLQEQEPGSNKYISRYSTMAEISDLFETRMANVMQCSDEACEIQKAAFNITPDREPDPYEAAYSHKFVLDIDGNGLSGRYYRLLKSRSVVVKSTILKEWHDDFLFPWVHFVPLSVGYHELPEIARFLATTERGLQLSERIARESSQWHDKVLRNVDLRIVWLRMLLEYGRLFNPDMTFTL